MKIIIRTLLLLICIGFSSLSFSQDLFAGKDLSQMTADQFTEAELVKYKQQIQAAGISESQAEKIAVAKGFPAAEAVKLRARLAKLGNVTDTKVNAPTKIEDNTEVVNPTSAPGPVNPRVFGSELFSTSSLTFQPDLKIATPMNYILGPDDELAISVYGLQEASFNLPITPEGIISIPNVGQLKLSGVTFEAATSMIRNKMSGIYSSLRSGSSKLSVTLNKIRSIRITILGAARPGTYTISSLSTMFNALYIAGGPAGTGTFRRIELIRNSKVDRVVDLYDFLLTGSDADNVRLKENDVIRIPVYNNRVDITGEVKRNGIYEMLPGETLEDLISYASGFTDSAYRASIKVIQLTDRERRVTDIPASQYAKYQPATGDAFTVSPILERYENRIWIKGAVFRPGIFQLTEKLTVSDLIRRADGLREDAYTQRGLIIRLKDDLTTEVIPFDIRDVLAGKNDIVLKREDVINIASIFDLRDEFQVKIQGEVRKPGFYQFIEVISLKDLILMAGGFTDAAYPQRIELARIIRRDTLTSQDTRLSQIIDIVSMNDLSLSSKNIALQPYDVVTIRRMPGYLGLESVQATGQFQYPGPYVLEKRAERVSDLIRRAGGLAPEAFPEGAYLRRVNAQTINTQVEAAKVDKIQKSLKDSTGTVVAEVERPLDQIPLDLLKIMANPGIDEDMMLKPDDILFIPRNDVEIKITGQVLFPTQAIYSKSNSLKDYIGSAGGFTDNARKKKIYVLYPNGKAARTKNFLFVRSFPEIKPGTEIIVPSKIEKVKKNNTAETAIVASILTSVAGIIIALTRVF